MQVSKIDNRLAFKACYRVPYSDAGYDKIMLSLPSDVRLGVMGRIGKYISPSDNKKNISTFVNAFPYAHLYSEQITSILIDNYDITKEEAKKFGVKLNKFRKTIIPSGVFFGPILNFRKELLKKKGIDYESLLPKEQYIYVTTGEDTNVSDKFMEQKVADKLEENFGDRTELSPWEYFATLLQVSLGPDLSAINPKRNFIQRLIDKHKANKEANFYQKIRNSIQELNNQLIVGNLSNADAESIRNEIKTLESQLVKEPEPRYVRNMRFLVDQYTKEKKRFKNIFFDNREITPVDTPENMIKILNSVD